MTREMFVPLVDQVALVNGSRCGTKCFYRWGPSPGEQHCYAFDQPLVVRGGVKQGYCRCRGCKQNQRLYGLGAEVADD